MRLGPRHAAALVGTTRVRQRRRAHTPPSCRGRRGLAVEHQARHGEPTRHACAVRRSRPRDPPRPRAQPPGLKPDGNGPRSTPPATWSRPGVSRLSEPRPGVMLGLRRLRVGADRTTSGLGRAPRAPGGLLIQKFRPWRHVLAPVARLAQTMQVCQVGVVPTEQRRELVVHTRKLALAVIGRPAERVLTHPPVALLDIPLDAPRHVRPRAVVPR